MTPATTDVPKATDITHPKQRGQFGHGSETRETRVLADSHDTGRAARLRAKAEVAVEASSWASSLGIVRNDGEVHDILTAMRVLSFGVLFATATVLGACAKAAPIETLRTALTTDEASERNIALARYPRCPDLPPRAVFPGERSSQEDACFTAIAVAFGSKKGFRSNPPDQAAASTVAVVLMRDHRGDWFPESEPWLGALRDARGAGMDALRIAMARAMADAVSNVGLRIANDNQARAAMRAIAGAIPGACPTYALLGNGTDALAPELSAEHAACVQRDLERRDGKGARYGAGAFRALEGALALWRDAERALRVGLPHANEPTRRLVLRQLARIEAASLAMATPDLSDARTVPATLIEAHVDAGVRAWPSSVIDADSGVPR
jgi:hypothetical protein